MGTDSQRNMTGGRKVGISFPKKRGLCLSSAHVTSMKEAGYELNSTNIH